MSPLYSRDRLVRATSLILPLILLFVFAVVAGRPFLSGASFLYSDDGLDHLLRVYALDRAIHQGIVFPRWVPDLALGYGCGSKPPYWNSREVIVREGTTFNFQG